YAALMSPGPPMHVFNVVKSYRNIAGFGVMLIDTPSPENRVTLDAAGDPRVAYTLSEADKQRFRLGVAQAVRIMFLAGAKELYLPTTENILGDSGAPELRPVILKSAQEAERAVRRLQFTPNRTIVTSAHMQGTNKMGATASNSVVSREFRVWGTERLFVVDS